MGLMTRTPEYPVTEWGPTTSKGRVQGRSLHEIWFPRKSRASELPAACHPTQQIQLPRDKHVCSFIPEAATRGAPSQLSTG